MQPNATNDNSKRRVLIYLLTIITTWAIILLGIFYFIKPSPAILHPNANVFNKLLENELATAEIEYCAIAYEINKSESSLKKYSIQFQEELENASHASNYSNSDDFVSQYDLKWTNHITDQEKSYRLALIKEAKFIINIYLAYNKRQQNYLPYESNQVNFALDEFMSRHKAVFKCNLFLKSIVLSGVEKKMYESSWIEDRDRVDINTYPFFRSSIDVLNTLLVYNQELPPAVRLAIEYVRAQILLLKLDLAEDAIDFWFKIRSPYTEFQNRDTILRGRLERLPEYLTGSISEPKYNRSRVRFPPLNFYEIKSHIYPSYNKFIGSAYNTDLAISKVIAVFLKKIPLLWSGNAVDQFNSDYFKLDIPPLLNYAYKNAIIEANAFDRVYQDIFSKAEQESFQRLKADFGDSFNGRFSEPCDEDDSLM